jgi:DNA polymerase III delta prime subunit
MDDMNDMNDSNNSIVKLAENIKEEKVSKKFENVHSPFISKYQPDDLNEFQQLDKTTVKLVKSLIHLNNLNVLIVGDSGTGKTSIIKSIIKEYYGNGNDYNHENVLVLNSLKEQGIQYYRNDLKIFCQTCSLIKNKKKIILLDDIDLINEQSQQVFRNYMDKYKHNVNFISSCTNIQKVIDSLQSRTIIVKIHPITYTCLQQIITKISLKEALIFSHESQELLLHICNSSIRILLNYLEKIKILSIHSHSQSSESLQQEQQEQQDNHANAIEVELIHKLSTNISYRLFDEYTNFILKNKMVEAVNIFYKLHHEGYSVMDILDNYFIYIKITNLLNEDVKYKLTILVCKYIIYFHNIHEDELELAFFTNNFIKLLQS